MKLLLMLSVGLILCGCQLHEGEAAEVRIKTQQNGVLTFGVAPDLDGEASPEEFYCNFEPTTDYGFVNRQHGVRYMAMISKHSNGATKTCVLTEQSKQKLLTSLKQYNDEVSLSNACTLKNEFAINIPTNEKRVKAKREMGVVHNDVRFIEQ